MTKKTVSKKDVSTSKVVECVLANAFRDDLENVHVPLIRATIDDISEDRRKWVKGQAGNTLMFRAATSFLYFLENQRGRPSSLNEALALRSAAFNFFEDQEQFDAHALRILGSFKKSDSPLITVEDNSEPAPDPDWMTDDTDEIVAKEEDKEAMLELHLPLLEGFLTGAQYDAIDLEPSEWMQDRARLAARKVFEAMESRCHQDVIFIGGKFKAAKAAHNSKSVEYWNGEGFFANLDRAVVKEAIKHNGYLEDE